MSNVIVIVSYYLFSIKYTHCVSTYTSVLIFYLNKRIVYNYVENVYCINCYTQRVLFNLNKNFHINNYLCKKKKLKKYSQRVTCMHLINVDNRSYLHSTSPKVRLLLYGNRDEVKQCIIDHC